MLFPITNIRRSVTFARVLKSCDLFNNLVELALGTKVQQQ